MNACRASVLGCAAVLWIPTASSARAEQTPSVSWRTNLHDALEQAAVERLPVMIDFYADWCGWCKRLDQTTYTSATVRNLSAQTIPVKVNTDMNPTVAAGYRITSLPTIVFLDHTGAEISRVVGFRDAAGFAAAMRVAIEPRASTDQEDAESADAAPSDEDRFAAADADVAAHRYADALLVWTSLAADGSSPAVRADALLDRAHTYRAMGDAASALADYRRYIALRPKPARRAEAELYMAHALHALHRPQDARSAYARAAKDARNTWVAHEAHRALGADEGTGARASR